MANLSASKIYRDYVEHTGTPYNIWLTAEKQLYSDKKGLNSDENVKSFNFYLNSRYRAGGKDLWERNFVKNIYNSPDVKEDDNSAIYNNTIIEREPEKGKRAKTETEPVLPFWKRSKFGMPMPVTVGLTLVTITTASVAIVQTIKYIKKKRSKVESL